MDRGECDPQIQTLEEDALFYRKSENPLWTIGRPWTPGESSRARDRRKNYAVRR